MPLTQICRLDRDVKDGYRLMCCGFVVVHGGTAVSTVRGCMVFQIQEGSSLDGRFLMFTCTLKSCKYLEKQATKRCRSNDENSQGAQLWNSYYDRKALPLVSISAGMGGNVLLLLHRYMIRCQNRKCGELYYYDMYLGDDFLHLWELKKPESRLRCNIFIHCSLLLIHLQHSLENTTR